ncbi:hypothetical protein DXG01_010232 [Tephrocybe rancida]|nr:hypothetical protein DXG01_010232 [Tephrocybe rancida]
MGGAQSLFYPDNPNRRLRAQQLADDCQSFQNEYDNIKREIQKELGPYTSKMPEVLNAFGCRNLDDLDKLVKETATKEGLQQWQGIKTSVDGLSDVSDIFTTAMAVVAIAGIVISAVGALAGGFGFLAGKSIYCMAVTSSILAVLGVIGLIFDAVSGAIQRSQLRDAINSLFKLRIQIKYLAEHIRNLQASVGGIKKIYAIFEKQGYMKDRIIEELRDSDTLGGLQQQTLALTYMQVAQDLLEMDKVRVSGSWRDEDPAWEGIASSLDAEVEAKKRADNDAAHPDRVRRKRSAGFPTLDKHFQVTPEMHNSLESEKRLLQMGQNEMQYVVPEAEKKEAVSIAVIFAQIAPKVLQGEVTVTLKEFVDEVSATVQLKTVEQGVLKANVDLRTIEATVISFATMAEAQQFATHRISSETSIKPLDFHLRADAKNVHLYLRADGTLDGAGDPLTFYDDDESTGTTRYGSFPEWYTWLREDKFMLDEGSLPANRGPSKQTALLEVSFDLDSTIAEAFIQSQLTRRNGCLLPRCVHWPRLNSALLETDITSENVARADRLQQLINNIGVIQTDIANEQKRMDALDVECRTQLDELLKAGEIETLQELKEKAMSKLTDEEKEEFNQLKGKAIMAIVRGIAGIQAVRVAVAAFVETIGGIVKGGASAGRALANAATKAREIANAAKKVSGLSNAESRVARVFRFLGRIGKWLSWFGVVLVAAAPLVEIFVGGQQKQDLIEGIHETQVTRLVVDALKHQARDITEQMSTTKMFLSLLKKGKKATAESIAEDMIETIKEQDDKISLAELEDGLREADKSTLKFYGEDDLNKDTVVQTAESERQEDVTEFKATLGKEKA